MKRTISRPSALRSVVLGGLTAALVLGLGGFRVRGVSAPRDEPARQKTKNAPQAKGRPVPKEPEAPPVSFAGVVLDSQGRPVVNATIVAGPSDLGRIGHEVLKTDAQGRFAWKAEPGTEQGCLVIHKQGLATRILTGNELSYVTSKNMTIRLDAAESFVGELVDADGAPVAGAAVRVDTMAYASVTIIGGGGTQTAVSYVRVSAAVVQGSPVEKLFFAKTDAVGSFTLSGFEAGVGLKLRVTTADGRDLRVKSRSGVVGIARVTMEGQGFVSAAPGDTAKLEAIPAARIEGRVVTNLSGVRVSQLRATIQESRQPGRSRSSSNLWREVKTDADGRFAFEGLGEGTVNVCVHGEGEKNVWTYRAAQDVPLKPGFSSEIRIELIRGVEVEGTVVAQGTGAAAEGAIVGVQGPSHPRSSDEVDTATADAHGRYRLRLPPGETMLYMFKSPDGFEQHPPDQARRTVVIPDDATKFEVPPIELKPERLSAVSDIGRRASKALSVGLPAGYRDSTHPTSYPAVNPPAPPAEYETAPACRRSCRP